MRELDQREVGMVSGGSPALITGAAGAFVGGVGSGIGYLLESTNPSASGFIGAVVVGTVSGALMGSGVKLVSMAMNGTRGVAAPGVSAIGLAYDCQRVDVVPVDTHDQPLDGVLTPSNTLWFD